MKKTTVAGHRVAIVLMMLVGCGNSQADGQRPTVRDSSGVRIVMNAPPSDALPVMRAGPPAVSIGTRNDTGFSLYRVRDARLLSAGSIVVVNGLELLWFYRNGRVLARNGGQGNGPNEFRNIGGIAVLPGDTVLVVNRTPGSAKVFGPNGELIRTVPAPDRMPARMERLTTGIWVGRQFGGESIPAQAAIFRERWYIARYTPQLNEVGVLYNLHGKALYGDRSGALYLHATPDAYFSARRDRVVAASSDHYEVRVFGADGRLLHVIRNSMPNPPVPPVPSTSGVTRTTEGSTSSRRLQPPVPRSAPAFSALLVANDGSVWIRRTEDGNAGQEWHVYNRDGVLIASAVLPTRFRPTEITQTHILGIAMDDLDVESIHLLPLIR